ncbi:hypothetical protein Y032_0205g1950 [Ancylostoma ceylanicum]|uniref:Saposin B-type domain-containing protein n=1 Tax=Ancylostoma ceylanicum TaxID=53326 RepID=A0A016SLS2_9BILA|nr:hypothetical protein Y032_0205g1950 [Ancylostoma ceylanicum]
MRAAVFLAVIVCISSTIAEKRKKPLCEMCEDVIEKLDNVLERGEDVEKEEGKSFDVFLKNLLFLSLFSLFGKSFQALEEYCEGDCPDFLKQYCEKIDQQLKYILEKLKEHDSPEKICTDIHLCVV